MALSLVLKNRRKALGLTLAQIADKMGVAEATVQRWESGNIKTLRYEKIGKLAEILQVSPALLMGWDDDISEYEIDPSDQKCKAARDEMFKVYGKNHSAHSTKLIGDKIAHLFYKPLDRKQSVYMDTLLSFIDSLDEEELHNYLALVMAYRRADKPIRAIIDTALTPYYVQDYANEMHFMGAPDDEIEKAVEEYRQALIQEKIAGSQISGANGSAAG